MSFNWEVIIVFQQVFTMIKPNLFQGWTCEVCTFVNQPTRPGCEMCGNNRPDDYQMPEHVVISREEQERLRKEQEVEAVIRQVSRHFSTSSISKYQTKAKDSSR